MGPTLLGSKAHIVNGFDGGSVLKKQAGSAQKKQEAKLAEQDAKIKGFVYGAHVEYYSTSYGEWIPATIGDVRPNGCLKLLHDDGSVLKMEADPNSVRLASKQAAPIITEADVIEAQAAWASAIKTISKTYLDKANFMVMASPMYSSSPQKLPSTHSAPPLRKPCLT